MSMALILSSGALKENVVGPSLELDYKQIVADLAPISATTEATSVAVITGNSVNYDGNRVKIEGWIPNGAWSAAINATFVVYRDSTPIGQAVFQAQGTFTPLKFEFFDTPAAGPHTYGIKAFVSGGSVTVKAGTGGAGQLAPAHMRVTKA